MDNNLKVEEVKAYYGDEADDDASDQDQNEDGLDIDQTSVDNGNQKEQDQDFNEETKSNSPKSEQGITANTQASSSMYPEPPQDFDEKRYKEECERYDPAYVAELMYAKKERKIPGSVMKPHSPYVHLVQTNVLRGAVKNVRVFFPYTGYCSKLKT